MSTIDKDQQEGARRAGRAFGAMFFAIFGGAWLTYWSIQTRPGSIMALALIIVLTVLVFGLAFNQYRQNKDALQAEMDRPQRQRAGRLFNIINAVQWTAILIGANVLANIGLKEWTIPFMIFVIGLHFLPLARIFSNSPHYVTGGALIALALTFPLFLPGGPSAPIGSLGTGLILWASAVWATRDKALS